MELKDQQMNLSFVIFAGLLISFLLTLKRHQESGQNSFFQNRYGVGQLNSSTPDDPASPGNPKELTPKHGRSLLSH